MCLGHHNLGRPRVIARAAVEGNRAGPVAVAICWQAVIGRLELRANVRSALLTDKLDAVDRREGLCLSEGLMNVGAGVMCRANM